MSFAHVDDQGFTVFECPLCGGASHPATGCVYARVWLVKWQASKGGKRRPLFYDHVRRVA